MLDIKENGEKIQLIDIDELTLKEAEDTYELMGGNLKIYQKNQSMIRGQNANYEQMIILNKDKLLQEEKNLALTTERMVKLRSFLKTKKVYMKKPESYMTPTVKPEVLKKPKA